MITFEPIKLETVLDDLHEVWGTWAEVANAAGLSVQTIRKARQDKYTAETARKLAELWQEDGDIDLGY